MKRIIPNLLSLFFCVLIHAQDWANLEHFKDKNAVLLKQESSSERIVFMGNSITAGWLKFDSKFFTDNHFTNREIGGQTTPQILLRFRQDVINIKATKVVILAGINDIAQNTGPIALEEIFSNIISMSELAIQNGIQVVLCSVFPANKFPWKQEILPAFKVLELNKLIMKYAWSKSILYVDYYAEMVDDKKGLISSYGYDPVHPNAMGYAVMKKILLDKINKT